MTADEFLIGYQKLKYAVLRVALINTKSQNSAYTQYSISNKNVYICMGCENNEDCYYNYWIYVNKDAVDCAFLNDTEIAYECVDLRRCYNALYCQNCTECRDLFLCYNCIGSTDCLGCIGLKTRRFHILNKPYSEEEYKKTVPEIKKTLYEAGWYSGKLPQVFWEG